MWNKNLIPSKEMISAWEDIEFRATRGPWQIGMTGISAVKQGYSVLFAAEGLVSISEENQIFIETVRDAFPVLLRAYQEQDMKIKCLRIERTAYLIILLGLVIFSIVANVNFFKIGF